MQVKKMILMHIHNASKAFGSDTILSNIHIEVKSNDRIAIVGRNGAGKSTLLKMMAGHLSLDEGERFIPKDVTTGYLDQHTGLESDRTIWEEMLDVFAHFEQQKQELASIEQKMAHADPTETAAYNSLLSEYDALQQTFQTSGGYTYEASIKSVLTGLGFYEDRYDTPIHTLSGGQKTRLALGKRLLEQPDILILDEPTNHLDIPTLQWLEQYIRSYTGAVVIVSHDRYFLDNTVSLIYELSRHKVTKYNGSYSYYIEQKALQYEKELQAYEQQQTEIKQMEQFVAKNLVRASTTKRAQSRRKQLEKMDKLDRPLGDESSASFSFVIHKRSGNDVLHVEELSFQFDDQRPLFSNVDMHIQRGERVALVGPNGVGKTTLLHILTDTLQPKTGSFRLGTNIQIGYYDQEQARLHSQKTVLHELWDDFPMKDEKDIRTVLGNFLFSGDDVLLPVHALSGGEKARLALAKLMLQKANFLILDEPTNHLDLDSKEILEAALQQYPGTILFVSHDRFFMNKVADRVLEMEPTGVVNYLGDYDYYVAKKQEQADRAAFLAAELAEKQDAPKQRRTSFEEEKKAQSILRKLKREITQIEEEIVELEETLAMTEEEMTEPEVFEDHEKLLELSTSANETKQAIEEKMTLWEQLQEELMEKE